MSVARFWSRVEKTEACWLWQGATVRDGYGQVADPRQNRRARLVRVHRLAYELEVGPIPEGLTIDHLCRVRHCVNPDHLEAVTMRVNVLRSPIAPTAINARKTYCKRGHPFTKANTILHGRNGNRMCRLCNVEATRQWRKTLLDAEAAL